jgi:hypothetical protein
MKHRIVIFLLAFLPASEILAKQDYTYIQSSLVFPWVMFFVFFALIMIPFFMVIALAWRNSRVAEDEPSDEPNTQSSSNVANQQKGLFNRFVLPTILAFVGVFSVLLVLNAYEAMDLMESYGTAAPTMLNARP